MTLTRFQKDIFRHHLHSERQIVDIETSEPLGLTSRAAIAFAMSRETGIAVGMTGFLRLPWACQIQAVGVDADVPGDLVVDIKRNGVSIVASAPPALDAESESHDDQLEGWTRDLETQDKLTFVVESAAAVSSATVTIYVKRS